MISIMRMADVFDANVMDRIVCVKGRECDGAYPYLTRLLTSRSLVMIAVSLARPYIPLRISVDREKE
jgi:hypothetical protein